MSNMNFHSWTILGSWGCREKKIQNAISMQLLMPAFFMFSWENFISYFFENTLASALKS
jgi:hypothetical protein